MRRWRRIVLIEVSTDRQTILERFQFPVAVGVFDELEVP